MCYFLREYDDINRFSSNGQFRRIIAQSVVCGRFGRCRLAPIQRAPREPHYFNGLTRFPSVRCRDVAAGNVIRQRCDRDGAFGRVSTSAVAQKCQIDTVLAGRSRGFSRGACARLSVRRMIKCHKARALLLIPVVSTRRMLATTGHPVARACCGDAVVQRRDRTAFVTARVPISPPNSMGRSAFSANPASMAPSNSRAAASYPASPDVSAR